ncbi:MAG TPA: hypothetical protein VLS90_08265 [Thermodesulfobacteriota bacterium]|nr:hypothetical protein [Thermodesulfobacteriota bacterium]
MATASFTAAAGPRINSIVDGQTYSTTITPTTTISIFGSGFSMGGNTVRLQRAGYADVNLFSGDGHYFWDGNGRQINASLDKRVVAGPWSVTVKTASGAVSAPVMLTVVDGSAPQIQSIVNNVNSSLPIKADSRITIKGVGFSSNGGNTVQLKRNGYADVSLRNGDGHYFWDWGGTIVIDLDNRAAAGAWSVTVRNADGVASAPYTMTIQGGTSAALCYSPYYPTLGYQASLCSPEYHPTQCLTSDYRWTQCP